MSYNHVEQTDASTENNNRGQVDNIRMKITSLFMKWHLLNENSLLIGFCIFIGFLSFKPSEPYLSQFLTCSSLTESSLCSAYQNYDRCNNNSDNPCLWDTTSSSCQVISCNTLSSFTCSSSPYTNYCQTNSNNQCQPITCFKQFTDNQVNNDIYPWSTYSYLIFLLTMGPFAELVSYRVAILCGVLGRVATRLLLLYGMNMLHIL